MQQVYVNTQDKQHFIVCSEDDLKLQCDDCKTNINLSEYAFLHRSFSKKEYVREVLCLKCIPKHRKRIYDEFIHFQLVDFIPEKSKMFSEFPPSLKTGNVNVFEGAVSNKGISADCSDVNIIDKTRLAGRESFGGASVGRDITAELEHKDASIHSDDALSLLEGLKNSDHVRLELRKVIDFISERYEKGILLTKK